MCCTSIMLICFSNKKSIAWQKIMIKLTGRGEVLADDPPPVINTLKEAIELPPRLET